VGGGGAAATRASGDDSDASLSCSGDGVRPGLAAGRSSGDGPGDALSEGGPPHSESRREPSQELRRLAEFERALPE
jgi:hypothetical protein